VEGRNPKGGGEVKDVFLKLAEAAKETIRHYAADFYYHDARVLFAMKPGDVALWAPRENGSALVIVARGRTINSRAMECFRAYRNTEGKLNWHLIDTDAAGNWTAEPTDTPEALINQYVDAWQANHGTYTVHESPVAELHL
jgi:hypothetical protein